MPCMVSSILNAPTSNLHIVPASMHFIHNIHYAPAPIPVNKPLLTGPIYICLNSIQSGAKVAV